MDETPKKKPSKSKKIRRIATNIIMICLAGIMLVSGWRVYTIMKGYHDDRYSYEKVSEQAGDSIDFDALREINPDVIGWLRYEGTIIDYPVVQGENNDVYLSMLFDRTWGGCGTLFADCITEAPFRQFNTIVYGHHMKDGTMFACLKELRDPEYCRKHPKLELITPEGSFDL
ncbi:MAG: class B sortase, partial [Mogibacterium sp.]|nr:class B sortase [Mogibacterium sp.]